MMPEALKYISESALTDLTDQIDRNLDLYTGDGFADSADLPSWDISLDIEYDADLLGTLDHSTQQNISEIDMANSITIGRALSQLSPSLANEECIWVRLAHVESFEYCRARWLSGCGDDEIARNVRTHFFAPTQTGIRDDHALSRLWWNYHIASQSMPDDPEAALKLIMTTADIRSNFVERIWMSSRRNLAGAILSAMQADTWITDVERHFRDFMIILNRFGGGIVFEALDDTEASEFVNDCIRRTKALHDA